MTSLKSLNIIPLPRSGSNPTLDRPARIIARLEEQKNASQRFDLHAFRPIMVEGRRWQKSTGRNKTACVVLMERPAQWFFSFLHTIGLETNRI
jgi:hypothetical protein